MGETRSRTVVITGASRGLGLATATHLHRQGWTVLAAMRNPEAGMASLKGSLGANFEPSRLIGIRLDLEDPSSIESAVTLILDRVGPPDGLVHNAGLAGAGAVEEMPVQMVEKMFTTNLFGPIRLTKGLLPRNAGFTSWSRRRRLESRSRLRCRGDKRLRGQQERARTMGRVAVGGDRTLRARGHRARCRDVQDRHSRAHAVMEGRGWPVRAASHRARVDGGQDGQVRSQARSIPTGGRARARSRRNRSPGMPSGPTLSQWNGAIGSFQRVGCSP